MPHIAKAITLKWDGKEQKLAITNELCNSLEESGINLFQLYVEILKGGQPKFFLLGKFLTALLNFSGFDVSQDDVMPVLTRDAESSVNLYQFARDFLIKVFPPPDDEVDSLGKSQSQ